MSEVKWIKISTDIFDNEKMFAIETQQDGFLLELVWFKILCLAGKCNSNGFLCINDKIAYTDEMLAKVFRMDIGTIQRAVTLFETLDMIEIVDNSIMISNWSAHQNQEALENMKKKNADRQRKYREKRKIEKKNCDQYNVTDNVTDNVKNNVNCSISSSLSNSYSDSLSDSNSLSNDKDNINDKDNNKDYIEPINNNCVSQDSLNNIQGEKVKKKSKKQLARREVYYPTDEKLDEAFKSYVEMRENIKKPFPSDHAIGLMMKKLEKLSNGDNDVAITILEESVMNGWQGLYELKEKKQENNKSVWDRWKDA